MFALPRPCLASCKWYYSKGLEQSKSFLFFIILCSFTVCCSLFLTQKGLCLTNYRGSCTALNQRLGVTALTKPVGKPVAEAAAFHSIFQLEWKCSNILRTCAKIKVFIKITFAKVERFFPLPMPKGLQISFLLLSSVIPFDSEKNF